MELTTFFAGVAAIATVATACIMFVNLNPDKQSRLIAASKAWGSRTVFVLVLVYSLATIAVFWLSSAPITKGAIVLVGVSFFNVAAWLSIGLMSKMGQWADGRRARVDALEAKVADLEKRFASMVPPTDAGQSSSML